MDTCLPLLFEREEAAKFERRGGRRLPDNSELCEPENAIGSIAGRICMAALLSRLRIAPREFD